MIRRSCVQTPLGAIFDEINFVLSHNLTEMRHISLSSKNQLGISKNPLLDLSNLPNAYCEKLIIPWLFPEVDDVGRYFLLQKQKC